MNNVSKSTFRSNNASLPNGTLSRAAGFPPVEPPSAPPSARPRRLVSVATSQRPGPRPHPPPELEAIAQRAVPRFLPDGVWVGASLPGGETRGLFRAPRPRSEAAVPGRWKGDAAPPLPPRASAAPSTQSQIPKPLPAAAPTSLSAGESAHPFPSSFPGGRRRLPSQLNPRPLPAPRAARWHHAPPAASPRRFPAWEAHGAARWAREVRRLLEVSPPVARPPQQGGAKSGVPCGKTPASQALTEASPPRTQFFLAVVRCRGFLHPSQV